MTTETNYYNYLQSILYENKHFNAMKQLSIELRDTIDLEVMSALMRVTK